MTSSYEMLPSLSIRLIMVMAFFFSRGTLTNAQCPTINILDASCVNRVDMPASCNFQIDIFEDCPAGTNLFTVEGSGVTISSCQGTFVGDTNTMVLSSEVDAETSNSYICSESITTGDGTKSSIVYTILDVNEYPPSLHNQGPAVTTYLRENNDPGVVLLNIAVGDDDYGETATMQAELHSTVEGIFDIEQQGTCDDATCVEAEFNLTVTQKLDYETGVFYEIDIDFTTTDQRGDTGTTSMKVLLFLNDTSDSPPFWLQTIPSASFNESVDAVNGIITVEARDRDTGVNNDICYRIDSGNEENYFTIGETTGEVSCPNGIDREALEQTSFQLSLTAFEVVNGDCANQAQEPSSVTQVTSFRVLDVNDNLPVFGSETLSIVMPELTSSDQLTSEIFTVTDLDEGDAGTYTLSSDDSAHLGFDSDTGSGVTDFLIKAIYVDEDNIFDYEKITDGNYDLSFIVTAKEVENAEHTNTMTVTITLEDVNDISPAFEEDTYNVSVIENSAQGTVFLTVLATDGDTSPDFGTQSLRYFLLQCDDYFTINSETGEISVVSDNALDYELIEDISCNLEVRDKMGQSPYLSGTAELNVVLEDLDDTPPVILSAEDATVSEGESVKGVVTSVSVQDVDTSASVSFKLEYDEGTSDAVISWFSINGRACEDGEPGNFCADIVVDSELDRETEPEVYLTIIATDDNTEANEASDSVAITITLSDVNDVAPDFCEDYTNSLSVYENVANGTAIAQIWASDPDVDDVLEFSCSNCTQVAIDQDTGVLSVVEDVDRETTPEITATISVTDAVNHTNTVVATIVVLDRNDNAPVLSAGFCDDLYEVPEDAPNGTEIAVVTSTDADEGAHKNVSYAIRSAQSGSPPSPFSVDPLSGSITVSLDPDNFIVLDRELEDEWLLQLQAFDSCEPNEAFCDQKVTSCLLTMTVTDVNDNAPYLASPVQIAASEELNKGEEVPDSTITARDKDLPNSDATEIHYVVTDFINLLTGESEDPAFEAIDFNEADSTGIMQWSCRLQTTKDLEHMAGSYNLTIEASDGPQGSPVNTAILTISIEIIDANDYTPEIVMGDCLVQRNQTITISEEMYTGGDCIPCYDFGPLLDMTYIDLDAAAPNNVAIISVNQNDSVVYPEEAVGQLEFFVMKQSLNVWHLCLSENSGNLSLEAGQAYNLSLKIEDEGTPTLFSYDWLYLNLTPVSEFKPNFGNNVSDCYATTYILEETTDLGGFRAAEDEDNAGEIYDIIYYYIIGGETSKFTIPVSTVPEVKPFNRLDRDDGPGSYTVLIQATNSEESPPVVGIDEPISTDMLQLTIVLIDQNDNAPIFTESIFYGSVLQYGSSDQVAVILEATDKDLNETLEYEMASDMTWTPDQNYGDDVFEVLDDSEVGTVWLRQDPKSLSGYCVFTAMVNDRKKEEHQDTTTVQIFIVKSSDEVPFSFKNDVGTLQEAQDDIEAILTTTFGYEAFVDSISTTSGSDNTTRDSVVEAHFVNTTKSFRIARAASANPGNLVSPTIIESMASSALTSSQLVDSMADIGLELYKIGDAQLEDEDSLEAQLLTYQIMLGVVSLVLLSIVFLLGTAYCVRTRKLERRVKVLTTNTFGSQSSGLNKMGVAAAPNSNLFKGEGTNPMFNISLQEFNNQDSGSISSGDSVLVGVEDNPEFSDYKADQGRTSKADPPAFVGADGVASNNPLFSVQPSAPAASSDGSDAGSYEDGDLGTPNPNFLLQ